MIPFSITRMTAVPDAPVAVKVDSRTLLHKTDIGGVRLDLENASQAVEAALARSGRQTGMGRAAASRAIPVAMR